MPLTAEKIAQLDAIYGNSAKPSLSPEKIAALDKIYGVQPQEPSVLEDTAKSALYRGVPEGLAAATPLGMAGNIVRGISDATRWAGGKIYQGITGEELPHYTENPVPTSSDMLQAVYSPSNRTLLGGKQEKLYEPKTQAGRYANTIAQFGVGGATSGVPLRNTVPAAVVSQTAGEAIPEDSDWQIPARIAGAALGGYTGGKLVGSTGQLAKNITKSGVASTEELGREATQFYDASAKMGGAIKPKGTSQIVQGILSKVDQPTETLQQAAKDIRGASNPVGDAINMIKGLDGKPLTLQEIDGIDGLLQEKISANITDKATVRQLKTIQNEVRSASKNLTPENLINPEAFDAWRNGDMLFAAKIKSKQIDDIVSNAYNQKVPSTGIQTGFRQLAKSIDKYGQQGWTNEEVAAIRRAAKTGVVGGALSTLGGKLISGVAGAVGGAAGTAGGGVGSVAGALAGAAAGEAAGFPLRGAANQLQKARATQVQRLLTNREAVQRLMQMKPAQAKQVINEAKKVGVSPEQYFEQNFANQAKEWLGKKAENVKSLAKDQSGAVPESVTLNPVINKKRADLQKQINEVQSQIQRQLNNGGNPNWFGLPDKLQKLQKEYDKLNSKNATKLSFNNSQSFSKNLGKAQDALENKYGDKIDVSFQESKLSGSAYLEITNNETGQSIKIRASDHNLPRGYEPSDIHIYPKVNGTQEYYKAIDEALSKLGLSDNPSITGSVKINPALAAGGLAAGYKYYENREKRN